MRGIAVPADGIRATVEGVNEMVDRIPTLTRIRIHYELRLPPGAPEDKVERALETHVAKCPTAQSLKGAVDVEWTADITEG